MTEMFFHLQDGATPLYIACQEGHLPVVKHLIAAKADVNCPREVGCSSTAKGKLFFRLQTAPWKSSYAQ